MSDQPTDQTPDPDKPEDKESTPEPSSGGAPAPDIPEVEDTGPNPVPGEPQGEVAPAEDSETSLGEAPAPGQGEMSESDDKTFGMLAHLLGAFTFLVGPIVIWMIKKEESPFVDDQGKEAVNWQIGVAIALVLLSISTGVPGVGCITAPLLPAVGVANLIFCILACVEANKGNAYRYPFNLRFIK